MVALRVVGRACLAATGGRGRATERRALRARRGSGARSPTPSEPRRHAVDEHMQRAVHVFERENERSPRLARSSVTCPRKTGHSSHRSTTLR
eukprot:4808926-Pyramimonas_sp.AAC.1